MPDVIVVGGGLAGMAAAVALESAGSHTTLLESRGFLGGRATDNCQHILLGCCANLLDFYQRLGVADQLHFDHEFHFIEPGGRVSELRQGLLSFARLPFLSPRAKFAIVRALATVRRDWKRRQDLDRITMLDWLREKSSRKHIFSTSTPPTARRKTSCAVPLRLCSSSSDAGTDHQR